MEGGCPPPWLFQNPVLLRKSTGVRKSKGLRSPVLSLLKHPKEGECSGVPNSRAVPMPPPFALATSFLASPLKRRSAASVQRLGGRHLPRTQAQSLVFACLLPLLPLLLLTSPLLCHSASAVPLPEQSQALLDLNTTSNGTSASGLFLVDPSGDVVVLNFTGALGVKLSSTLPPSFSSLTGLTYLNLANTSLGGPIPPAIQSFLSLQHLDLSNNSFIGTIPPFLAKFSSLTYLNLSLNALSGPINLTPSTTSSSFSPSVALPSLPSLSILDLRGNKLNGSIPLSLSSLSSLQCLNVSANPTLSGPLPDMFLGLSNLTSLILSNANLTGSLPPSLSSLQNLLELDAESNSLTGGLPSTFPSLSKLTKLNIASNPGLLNSTLPSSVLQLYALQSLKLTNTSLFGTIPDALSELQNLTKLIITDNKLNGTVPASVCSLPKLEILHLERNKLTGKVPEQLSQLSRLQVLFLASNSFDGSIPIASLSTLSYLKMLDLEYNQLTGSIPDTIGALVNLTRLDISYNRLSGTLPSTLGNLAQVQLMYVNHNEELTGAIPPSMGQLQKLETLVFKGNNMTGPVPDSLSNLTNLQRLEFPHNHFLFQPQATVPAVLASIQTLTKLTLNNCSLSGSIPDFLGNLTNLEWLDISSNGFSGSIPDTLSMLRQATLLALGNNSISGTIPSAIGQLTALQKLGLGSNMLSGEIPDSIGQLTRLNDTLDLSYNQLEGTIPESISQLQSLRNLNLTGNWLEGEGHGLAFLGHLAGLQNLSLAHNLLNGSIPEELVSALPQLQYLNLQGNPLTGSLPTSLGQLPKLTALDVPPTLSCPFAPCTSSTVVRNNAFCARCTPFCASCPPAVLSSATRVALNAFLEESAIQARWEVDAAVPQLDGVSLSTDNEVTGIALANLPGGGIWNTSLFALNASLESLVIINCHLSNSLPAGIGQLSLVTNLALPGNSLNGSLPQSLGNMTSLEALSLEGNSLSGSLPDSLGQLHNLSLLNLAQPSGSGPGMGSGPHGLSGSIPEFLGDLTALQFLDLSNNQLTGGLPNSLSKLSLLTLLRLNGNNLTSFSSLPSWLGTLPLKILTVAPAAWANNLQPPACPRDCPSPYALPHSAFCSSDFCQPLCDTCPKTPSPPPRPPPPAPPSPPSGIPMGGKIAIGVAAAVVLVFAILVAFLIWRSRRRLREEDDDVGKKSVLRFSLHKLSEATTRFLDQLLVGGPGQVFRGHLPYSGAVREVAVRVPSSMVVGHKERGWRAAYNSEKTGEAAEEDRWMRQELRVLSGVHHRHIIELLGYCKGPRDSLVLVYEWGVLGTLEQMLHSEISQPLAPLQKLKVALGVALGLDYIHSQVTPPTLHCDVRSGNVVVLPGFEAKLCGFGFSVRPSVDLDQAEISSLALRSQDTQGYLDPAFYSSGMPSEKSDVYSFGVILLELATGTRPVEEGEHILFRVTAGITSSRDMSPVDDSRVPSSAAALVGPEQEEDGGARGGCVKDLQLLKALGVSCCALEPRDRPRMRHVAEEIEGFAEAAAAADAAAASTGAAEVRVVGSESAPGGGVSAVASEWSWADASANPLVFQDASPSVESQSFSDASGTLHTAPQSLHQSPSAEGRRIGRTSAMSNRSGTMGSPETGFFTPGRG